MIDFNKSCRKFVFEAAKSGCYCVLLESEDIKCLKCIAFELIYAAADDVQKKLALDSLGLDWLEEEEENDTEG